MVPREGIAVKITKQPSKRLLELARLIVEHGNIPEARAAAQAKRIFAKHDDWNRAASLAMRPQKKELV